MRTLTRQEEQDIKRRFRETYFAAYGPNDVIPDITGWGIALDRETRTPCIKVYASNKRALRKLPDVFDGLPVKKEIRRGAVFQSVANTSVKKFLISWLAVFLVLDIIPSILVAAVMIHFYGSGDAPSSANQSAFTSGIYLSFMLMNTIAQFAFWPAIVVLLIGIVICQYKSSNRRQ